MLFLPYECFKIVTNLNADQIRERLTENVDSAGVLRRFYSEKLFLGWVKGDSFKIRRKIGYRNSYLPIVVGQIQSSDVNVRLRLNLFVLVFSILWLSIALSIAIATWQSVSILEPTSLMPLLFVIIGYGMPIGLFNWEAKKTKQLLEEVLKN